MSGAVLRTDPELLGPGDRAGVGEPRLNGDPGGQNGGHNNNSGFAHLKVSSL
jgi:hypothetical protein